MVDRFKILELKDNDEYCYKYKFCVLVFAGMKPSGKPIYRIAKQARNDKRAREYIDRQLKKGLSEYI